MTLSAAGAAGDLVGASGRPGAGAPARKLRGRKLGADRALADEPEDASEDFGGPAPGTARAPLPGVRLRLCMSSPEHAVGGRTTARAGSIRVPDPEDAAHLIATADSHIS